MHSLEECAFGPHDDEQLATVDRLVDCMLPLTCVVILVLVVVYSLCKCTQYHELMRTQTSCRNTIILLNVVAIILTMLVVAYSAHRRDTPTNGG
jgi:hypothetical protein